MKKKRIIIICSSLIVILCVCVLSFVLTKNLRIYNKATQQMDSGDYDNAIQTFTSIQDYKDSSQQINECYYQKALNYINEKDYTEANKIFRQIPDYEKTQDGINECNYQQALDFINELKYKDAIRILKDLDYKDSSDILVDTQYTLACDLLEREQYLDAIDIFKSITYKDSAEKCIEAKYDFSTYLISKERYEDAIEYLSNLNYKDSEDLLIECQYNIGKKYYTEKNYESALIYLEGLNYKDSNDIVEYINNNPYSLRKFVERYNNLMFELDKAGQIAVSLYENDFINGKVTLSSGGVLSLNNDQNGKNYVDDVTNFNFLLENADSYDLRFAMSEMYAIVAAMDPNGSFNTSDEIITHLLDGDEYSKNGIEYDNYSMTGMILLVGTRQ